MKYILASIATLYLATTAYARVDIIPFVPGKSINDIQELRNPEVVIRQANDGDEVQVKDRERKLNEELLSVLSTDPFDKTGYLVIAKQGSKLYAESQFNRYRNIANESETLNLDHRMRLATDYKFRSQDKRLLWSVETVRLHDDMLNILSANTFDKAAYLAKAKEITSLQEQAVYAHYNTKANVAETLDDRKSLAADYKVRSSSSISPEMPYILATDKFDKASYMAKYKEMASIKELLLRMTNFYLD